MGHRLSPLREIVSVTDGEGRAEARFPCYDGQFSSTVCADGFYEERSGDVLFRRANDGVVVEHLLEHHRDVPIVLRRRINPIPMFRHRIRMRIPASSGRFGFDLKKGDWIAPHGDGEIADFWLLYEEVRTNSSYRSRGIFEFTGKFNGAYVQKKNPCKSFSFVYAADTNATYNGTLDFYAWEKNASMYRESLLVGNESFLVVRSRASQDANGRLLSCHYSLVGGCIYATEREFHLDVSFFNPTPNDTNLEFDEKRNLAPRRRKR